MNPTTQLPTKPEKVIKFDMSSDERSRKSARSGYEIAKKFKEAGIKFSKIVPASADPSIIKMFKLADNNELYCLEVPLNGLDATQQTEMINDIKDHFLVLDGVKLINEQTYKYNKTSCVYRFLFKMSTVI